MSGQNRLGRLSGALAFAGALAASGAVAPAEAATVPTTTTPIKHVIVLFQENVSFDHYFATYPNALFSSDTEMFGQSFTPLATTPTVNGLSPELLKGNLNQNNTLTAFVSPARLAPNQAYTCSNSHAYLNEQQAEDKGLMDRFPGSTGATPSSNGEGCLPDGSTVMGYYDGNTVTALWNYAQRFAMSDNSFGSTFGPSTPGVINLVSGQTLGGILHHAGSAVGSVYVNSNSAATGSGLSETVTNVTDDGDNDAYLDDCGKDKGGTVVTETLEMTSKNIGDLLNAKHITWAWFQGGFEPTTPATLNRDGTTLTPAVCGASHIEHLWPNTGTPLYSLANEIGNNLGSTNIQVATADYVSHHAGFMFYASTRNPHHLPGTPGLPLGGPDTPNLPFCAPYDCTGANHNYDASILFDAIKDGTLPAVSFVKAPAYQNGHPGNSDPLVEQTWLVQIVNAVMNSSLWKSTAIIIAYDDSDGWYDHVSSPIVNQSNTGPTDVEDALAGNNCGTAATAIYEGRCGHGFRQPLIMISPYSKRNFVDHTLTNQASIIAFIEYNWNLGTIGTIDGSTSPETPGAASFDQTAGTLLNMLNFKDAVDSTLILNENGTIQSGSP
jgi:phospholipase C